MGEDVGDKDNDEFDGGLNPEEAIEFLKLVEQARSEASPGEEPLEAPPEIDKPRKRFRLKSKGKKKESGSSDGDSSSAESTPAKRMADGEVRLAPDVLARAEAQAKSKKKSSRATAESPSADPPTKKSRWLEALLACAVVASLIHFAWPSASADPKADSRPVVAPRATQPDTATVYFLRAVYTERLDEAYALLSSEKQSELGDQRFRELVGAFLLDNKETLTRVEVDSIESDSSNAVLSIRTQDSETLWSVGLVKQEDFWFVSAVRGGTLEI